MYQVYIPRDSESIQHVEFASSRYWQNLKKEGFGYDRNAFNIIDTKRSILVEDRPTIMGAVSDLQGKLRAIYGNEYANRVIHTSNDYSPHSAKVTEYLEFSVEYVNTLTWLEAMTIAAFIAGFGLPANWAKLLSDVLGAAGVYAIIARGTSVDHYRCVALFTRYGCIDDIALSSATRSDVYDGFEHEGVVEMESYSERETIYAPSEYKYTTYSVLLHEAYDLYLAIYE